MPATPIASTAQRRDEAGEDDQREPVAELGKQHLRAGHDEELAERAARGDDSEGEPAPLRRHHPPDRAEHDHEGGRSEADSDQEAEA